MVKPKYGISHYGLGLKYESITNLYTTAGLALDSTQLGWVSSIYMSAS
jgi:hypothetical protein